MKSPAKIPASDAVRWEWQRRIEAEYRSAAIAVELTHRMLQLGLSPDLLELGLRITQDELDHTELSHQTFTAAGGLATTQLDRDSLALPPRARNEPIEREVTRVCVEMFCLGETVAVALFKQLRDDCTVPVARRALDRILRDEVRHRDFGWLLLTALLQTPAHEQIRAYVLELLPGAFQAIRRAYAPAHAGPREALPDADRAWGLMDSGRYAAAVERTLKRDWLPRFAKLGIDARAAYDAQP